MVLFSSNGTNIEFSHQSQNGFAIDLACYNVDMAKETAFQVRSLASDAWIIGFIHSHLSRGPHLHPGKYTSTDLMKAMWLVYAILRINLLVQNPDTNLALE
jgi:hypothetical protein